MAEKRLRIERAVTVPGQAMRAGVGYGLRMLIQTKELFVPVQTGQQFARQLQREKPLSDSMVALDAIEVGRKRDIPELEFIGQAALTKALLRAEDSPHAPPVVAATVVQRAGEMGLQPDLVPLIGDADARRATEIMRSYDTVTHLFPRA